MASTQTTNNFISADGLNLFYREAAPKNLPNAPIILLLHGFPSSSHQYRNLIPLLSQKYRVLAPDLPGFGFTEVPSSRNYTYTFSSLTTTILAFVDALQIKKFAIYVFDYGAPTGLRLALERPEAITAIITQNGNAYTEGLSSSFWNPIKEFWTTQNTQSDREALGKEIFALETTKWQYVNGEPSSHLKNIAPESYHLDYFLLNQPGNIDVQLSLFYDYQNNVKLYPDFQRYFRESGVPILAVWGKNDDIFVKAGAEAFKRDGKETEVVLLDAGHFAVESHVEEVADAIVGFLGKRGI